MNFLIVFAHPEPQSLNGQLLRAATSHLTALGHQVKVTDLFQEGFKSHANQDDFTAYQADFFDLQAAQQQGQLNGTLADDIQQEQTKLLWADCIIFQFPLWWFSVPAPLKGYIDRVFTMGFAYGGTTALAGKKVLISTTTGAPQGAWTPERKGTMAQVLFPITHGTFSLLGLEVLTPFVAYGTKRFGASEKSTTIKRFTTTLAQIAAAP